VMFLTPMPHSVRRFPPRKPVTPSTTNPRRTSARYTRVPPTSEPQRAPTPGREYGEEGRCGEGQVLVDFDRRVEARVVLVGQVRQEPRDGRRDSTQRTEQEQEPRGRPQMRSLSAAKSKPTLTKSSAIGKWLIAPWWLNRFSRESATLYLVYRRRLGIADRRRARSANRRRPDLSTDYSVMLPPCSPHDCRLARTPGQNAPRARPP
jgi:hypothetical protein